MKKTLTYIHFRCGAVVLLVLMFASCATTNAKKSRVTGELSPFYYETKKYTKSVYYLETDISYPSFMELETLSAKIQKDIMTAYYDFEATASAEWKALDDARGETGATDETPPFEYRVNSTTTEVGNDLSVLVETYTFTGGAHGETKLSSYTFDNSNGVYPTIEELTGKNDEALSQYCRSYLKTTLDYDDGTPESIASRDEWIQNGTMPEHKTFSVFTINEDSVTVYFAQYEVAPYSYGIITVDIPRVK